MYATDYAPYQLSIIPEPVPADDGLEPNDGYSTATVVTLPYESPELTLVVGDEDWFTVRLEQAGTLYADIDARSEGSELWTGMRLSESAIQAAIRRPAASAPMLMARIHWKRLTCAS